MMMRQKTVQRFQRHYQRLRNLLHERLLRQAEQATASNDRSSDEELWHHSRDAAVARQVVTNETAPRRIDRTSVIGFVLVYIAALAAAVSLDPFSTATSFDDAPWAPWLIALLLGSVTMAILVNAKGAIHKSMRFGQARWLVAAGLVLAVVAAFVVALPILGLAASLAEGL